jgi:hypothetical protein
MHDPALTCYFASVPSPCDYTSWVSLAICQHLDGGPLRSKVGMFNGDLKLIMQACRVLIVVAKRRLNARSDHTGFCNRSHLKIVDVGSKKI